MKEGQTGESSHRRRILHRHDLSHGEPGPGVPQRKTVGVTDQIVGGGAEEESRVNSCPSVNECESDRSVDPGPQRAARARRHHDRRQCRYIISSVPRLIVDLPVVTSAVPGEDEVTGARQRAGEALSAERNGLVAISSPHENLALPPVHQCHTLQRWQGSLIELTRQIDSRAGYDPPGGGELSLPHRYAETGEQ